MSSATSAMLPPLLTLLLPDVRSFSLSKQAVPQDVSARILREARAQQEELDAEDLQQTTAAAAGPAQIPAGAIAAALQQLHDSDSEGGDDLDGFTEAGSVWGGDDVSGSLCLLLFSGYCNSLPLSWLTCDDQWRVGWR
jgi:hypothetical protein